MGLAGYTNKEIAALLGVHKGTISLVLTGRTWQGVEPGPALAPVFRPSYRPKMTPEQRLSAKEAVASGENSGSVAARYGVTRQAINALVRKG